MNSGLAPIQIDLKLGRKIYQMAMGMRKYEGKASMLKVISILKANDRDQGTKHFCLTADSFLLSIMISDLTNIPASEIFYENASKKFTTNNFINWVLDKKVLQLHMQG